MGGGDLSERKIIWKTAFPRELDHDVRAIKIMKSKHTAHGARKKKPRKKIEIEIMYKERRRNVVWEESGRY